MTTENGTLAPQSQASPNGFDEMYQESLDAVAGVLRTDLARGLTQGEAQRRQAIYGANKLAEAAGTSFWAVDTSGPRATPVRTAK